jgi:hypothetical protein
MADRYELEFFAEDDGTKPVLAWVKNDLTPAQRRAVGTAMRRVLQANGVGVCWSPPSRAGAGNSARSKPPGPACRYIAPAPKPENRSRVSDMLMSNYTYPLERRSAPR